MKRILYPLVLLLFMANQVMSQKEMSYTINLREGAVWTEVFFDKAHAENGLLLGKIQFQIKGDSLIEGVDYMKLYSDIGLVGMVRNQEGILYLRFAEEPSVPEWLRGISWGEKEEVWYFFGNHWEPGDSIIWSGGKYILSETDTVRLTNGEYRKKYASDTYGIGDTHNGIVSTLRGPADDGKYTRLASFYENGTLLFKSEYGEYQVVGIDPTLPHTGPDFQIHYSPEEKKLKILSELPQRSYTTRLFTPSGMEICSFAQSSYYTENLLPGIYLIRIQQGKRVYYTGKIRIE